MKRKQLPVMILAALVVSLHSVGTVDAAMTPSKSKVSSASKITAVKAKAKVTPSAKVTTSGQKAKGTPSASKSKVTPSASKAKATTSIPKAKVTPSVSKAKVTPSASKATVNTGKKATTTTATAKSKASSTAKSNTTGKANTETKTNTTTKEYASQMERVEHSPEIRVLLGSRTKEASVFSDSGVNVLNGSHHKVTSHKMAKVSLKGNKIAVNGKAIDSVVTLQPTRGDMFTFEDKNYRGTLSLWANNGSMMVINSVPLESYLYGVVPQEVVPTWPEAALEAQAVAARTYALHTMEANKHKPYDVSPTTAHQVYGGVDGETYRTTEAVDRTKGMVMLYNNRPINALFHSDGGGYTENSVNVWGNEVPYLKGVKDFVNSESSVSNWTVTTNRQSLESKLNAAGKGVGKLKSIQLTPLSKQGKETADRGISGRIKEATFVGSSGKVTLSGDDLRNMLGLKSTLFDFYINHNPVKKTSKAYHTFTGKNDSVYIKGHGWGHGLGMSQWGAAEMARRADPGDTDYYQTILKYYYSGITLKKMY
ncbi:SpoIID/LytB domain-containing protein [Veillonella agrestimuris]|uniref:SpoIID/LytB domain-containing protein n=1 Tax=Veillonella agrestimuris TaxID=2941340 RepID=UPI00203D215E|nr:SpoIID/LytB domain-containing protein [Veillonella agrestimuris]